MSTFSELSTPRKARSKTEPTQDSQRNMNWTHGYTPQQDQAYSHQQSMLKMSRIFPGTQVLSLARPQSEPVMVTTECDIV